jgi:AhpD family alkylhydroperoxidase
MPHSRSGVGHFCAPLNSKAAVDGRAQCPYCLEIHRKAAEAAGCTQQELAETAMVAAALRAGAAVTHATHILGGKAE